MTLTLLVSILYSFLSRSLYFSPFIFQLFRRMRRRSGCYTQWRLLSFVCPISDLLSHVYSSSTTRTGAFVVCRRTGRQLSARYSHPEPLIYFSLMAALIFCWAPLCSSFLEPLRLSPSSNADQCSVTDIFVQRGYIIQRSYMMAA